MAWLSDQSFCKSKADASSWLHPSPPCLLSLTQKVVRTVTSDLLLRQMVQSVIFWSVCKPLEFFSLTP